MVLCSITIHGLSIPGFSLGRHVHSVSRTWSRHAPPEWMNQARLVSRGAADIVVNRDRFDSMERGETQTDEKQLSEPSTRPNTGDSSPQKTEDRSSSGTTLRGQEEEQLRPPTSEGARPDAPPDGTGIVSEWREPHHRIIERRRGPGEDVCFSYMVKCFVWY